MSTTLKEKLLTFAHGYIACAQTYASTIDDEWVDYDDYCLNFYYNGNKLIVSVYPMHYVEGDGGKLYHTQDTANPVFENLLESDV
jgi:hypothetical protein